MPELIIEASELQGNQDLTNFKTTDDLAKGYLDLKGKVSSGSIDLLPEDIRKDGTISNYKTISELAKGHIETKKMVGAKGVIIPGKDAKPDEWDKFYNTLGRPEKPEGYVFKTPDKLHAAIKVSPEFENGFKARMHAKGVPQGLADSLYQDLLNEVSSSMVKRDDAQEKARLEGLTKLNQKWGKDTDTRLKATDAIVKKVAGEERYKTLGDFANNSAMVEVLYDLTNMLSEDSIKSLGGVEQAGADDADKEIKSLYSMSREDMKKHPYWDENHPKHAEEVKRVKALYEKREAAKRVA